MRRENVVWEPGARGWRRVRARVPASPRSGRASERVPRPPSFRFAAAGAEDARRSRSSEVEMLGAHLAREVAREVVERIGGGWAVFALLALGRKRRQP